MSDIKTSQFLAEVMEYSKTIGNKRNPPFTAERFVIAIIDKSIQTADSDKSEELRNVETLLKSFVGDMDGAKNLLMSYITEEKSTTFLDDLYMKKRMQEAKSKPDSSIDGVSTVVLLECIAKEPSDALKKVFTSKTGSESDDKGVDEAALMESLEAKFDELFGAIEEGAKIEDTSDITDVLDSDENNGGTKIAGNAKGEMATLVSDVKRIRKELGNAVFGQDNAINVFATGYFQASMLSMIDKSRTRPRATFLFAGPPGVGKTFMAEKAAEALKLPFMRFDMSEYADKEANLEFCGSDKVYKNAKAGNVTSFVAENPKCVLLFDEIEKAHICVIHLFLQMLDAGRLRDNYTDKEVSFSDAIIILTTNAGKQLYEDSETGDFSSVSRKVIVKALQKDVNPETGVPYFPGAICSRFASGNVVMFNHISASFLRTIAKKEIERHAANLKKETGMELLVDDEVYTTLLFSEGASVDARTIRGRAESFFNDELYELLRLIASDKVKTSVDNIEKVHISVDFAHAKPEVLSLYEFSETPKILVFADDATVAICKEKLPSFDIIGVQDLKSSIDILKSDDIGFVMLDMRCGASAKALASLNIEDVDSPARDFYRFIREHRSGLPVYLIEGRGNLLAEEEKISFMRQGVRGVLRVARARDSFATTVASISTSLHQQSCMAKLAKSNKLVSFETSQSISKNGKSAEIKLFDLDMSVAIDSEDSKNVLSSVSKPNVKFDDVIGAKDAKKELAYFVEYLRDPKKYTGTGVKAPRGVLLYGPPGTGKTMLAKAMANESNVTFIAAEGNQFLKQYVGEGPAKVHELFKTARKYAPAILFVDEIDAIAKERRGSASASGGVEETLTAFLTEMDGFVNDTSRPVFVLAATNFDVEPGGAKSLDPALMRRFDRRVYIELPGKEERIKFMNMKICKNPAFDVSKEQIDNIAMRSTGMSLAELDSAMELALRSAIREGSTKVTDAILEEAFETFNNGETKKWDASQLERVARHEAGHAFMCWYSGETPSYLTIVARGNHGGYMQHADKEGKAIYTKEELLSRIKTSLGGRAAEIAYYGDQDGISTGASGDLASATNVARQIVCTYGMDSEFGLAVVTNDVASNGTMSIEVREAVNRILKEQMEETVRIIAENRDKIDALVEELMLKNHMNGHEIEKALTKNNEQEASRITSAE